MIDCNFCKYYNPDDDNCTAFSCDLDCDELLPCEMEDFEADADVYSYDTTLDSYEYCWESGNYDDALFCDSCPHSHECSGSGND